VSATQKLLRFGVFELNLDAEELRKSETVVKLSPQAFKLLAFLVSHAGQVVSRDEIQKQLWGEETFVDFEHGVNKCIKQIRNVLGDNADKPLYIETLPRHGYRFVAPVVSKTIPAPKPRVVESESGERSRGPLLVAGGAGAPAVVATVAESSYSPAVTEHQVGPVVPVLSRLWRVGLWGAAGVVLLALIAGGIYWRVSKGHTLTEKDTIVIADFDNKIGDPVVDLALREGLSAQLDQSPFLSLLSNTRISHTLTLMTKPKDARLTEEIAREVCQRTGSAATIEGSISTLGSLYVVGLKALDCHNGDRLADEQVTAKDKDHVLQALGEAATKLRQRLGESLASVHRYDVPADDVTTSSLEALQAYSLGNQKMSDASYPAAIAQFQRAVSLDPAFAMAYARLAAGYNNLGQMASSVENIRKAYELRYRVSEREKFVIAKNYVNFATGNADAALRNYELWAQTYPRDITPSTNMGAQYLALGDHDKALAAFQNGLKLDPGNSMLYGNLGFTYLLLNRLDEAKATVQEAQARQLENPTNHFTLYQVGFLQRDAAGMERGRAGLMGKVGYEDQVLYLESDTAAYAGEFTKAREFSRRAVDSAERTKENEAAAADKAESAVREALVGNMETAEENARAALALSKGREAAGISAVALALAGDTAHAKGLADDLAGRYPEDTIVQFNYLPTIRAAAALSSTNPAEALEHLKPAAPYELGWIGGLADFNLYPIYLRGEAYLAAHRGSAAAIEFQKILDHPGVVQNEPIGALAHLGLGRAFALSGDTTKAKAAYQDFLTLWKNADPDIPIYKQAKAEYAKLQ
jgi:eukaryotic-like serine/threonine-protein kinase